MDCNKQDNDSMKWLYTLTPGVSEYVTLQGKRDFADIIMILILNREIILDYQVNSIYPLGL